MKKHLQFEQLEHRQLLAADILSPVPNAAVADSLENGVVYATNQTSNSTSSAGAIPASGSVMSGAPYFGPEDLETRVLKIADRYLFRSAEEIIVFTPSPSGEWVRTASLDLDAPILELVADDTGTRLLAVTGYREGYEQNAWNTRTGMVTYRLLSLNEDGIPMVLDQMSRVGGDPGRTELGTSYSNAVEFDSESGSFLIHHAVSKIFAESVRKNFPSPFEFDAQKGKSAEADFLRTVYLVNPLSDQLPDNPVVSGYNFITRALNNETLLVSTGGQLNIVNLQSGAESPVIQLLPEEFVGRVNQSTDIQLTENGLTIVGFVKPLNDPAGFGDWGTFQWDSKYNFQGFTTEISGSDDESLDIKDRQGAWAIEWYKLTRDREYAFGKDANLVTRLLGGMRKLVERVDGEFIQHEITLDNFPAGTYVLDQDHVVALTVDLDSYPVQGQAGQRGEVFASLHQRNENNEFVLTERVSLGNDFSARLSLSYRNANLSADGVLAIRDFGVAKVLRVNDGKLDVQSIKLGDHSDGGDTWAYKTVAGFETATIFYNYVTGESSVYPASQSYVGYAGDVDENGGTAPEPQSPLPEVAQAYDTDGDGTVSPLDVLALVNYLNTQSNRGDMNTSDGEDTSTLDVDGDGSVSPLDVLAIVNYINNANHRVAPEGEGAWEAAKASSVSADSVSADELFSEVDFSPVPFYAQAPSNSGETSAVDLEELRKRGLR